MAMLPVPEEVKNMHRKIEQALEMLSHHSRLLERIVERIAQLNTNEERIAEIRRDLSDMRNSLTVIKDSVRFDKVA
jgi:replicative DNA helicase